MPYHLSPAARLTAALPLVAVLLATTACEIEDPSPMPVLDHPVRVALFNVRELSAAKLEAVDADGAGTDPQLVAAAAIVRRMRPDVLVIQEIDYPYGEDGAAAAEPERYARAFAERYLARGGAPGDETIDYPYAYAAPVNTGVLSGFDLNGDGVTATAADLGERAHGDDSLGFGTYPGQYGMAVLSRHPLVTAEARTFQRFPWRDLPGNHLPAGHYPEEAMAVLPLSSKSHWDLPVDTPTGRLHLWISHPTPPIFDGEEDRNGRRNYDEIAFWRLYLDGSEVLVDDAGVAGGYGAGEPFLVVGDLNADPASPEARYEGRQAVGQLLAHPRLHDAGDLLVSTGAADRERVGAADPAQATAAFRPLMRLDHLIPGPGATPVDGGVFWPSEEADPEGARLAEEASDHRLVWLDLELR